MTTEPKLPAGEELKPCPFCGGSDISLIERDDGLPPYYTCNDCGVIGPYEFEDITAWNTRAKEPTP